MNKLQGQSLLGWGLGDDSWKNKLPKGIAEMIIADKMFGWKK